MSANFRYDWYCYTNDDDDDDEQEIDGAMEIVDNQTIPSNQKVADLLGVDEFTEWSDIYLKHKPAFSIGSRKKKFFLWNATHDKLRVEVRYSAQTQNEVRHEKGVDVDVGAALDGGNLKVGRQHNAEYEYFK